MALKGTTNEEKAWNFMLFKIGNAYGTAGLLGNLYAESRLLPNNLQNSLEKKSGYTDDSYTKAVDNGTYTNFIRDSFGYGLAQWTYWNRKQNLLNYAKGKGKSIGDLEMQLEFLYEELIKSYKSVWNSLKSATSVQSASDVVLTGFEKPADQSSLVKTARAKYGQKYYEQFVQEKGGHGMISNCGHDENGKYSGGKAGDQTGTEYCVTAWYNRPWACVLRYPDASVGADLAAVGIAAAQNNLVGYDQGQRGTYHLHLKASKWDPSKVSVACEADCSSSTAANVIAVGYRKGIAALQKINSGMTTSNMRQALKNAGFTVLTDSKYLTSDKYLLPGDILLYDGHHVAINVSTGSAVGGTTTQASTGLSKVLQAATNKDASINKSFVTTSELNLRYGAGSDKYAVIVTMPKGTKVRCYGYYSKDKNSKKWYYVVATVNGKQYTGYASSSYLK